MSLQTIFKDSKGRWRDDVLWKIVPYTWHSDRKWPITHGRKASSLHLVGGDLNASTQQHDRCTLRCVIVASCMPLNDRSHRSVSHQHINAGRVNGSQWSAAGRRSTEGKVWHQGRSPEIHHTPWSQVMRKKIRLARAVAGLTGRIETIVVLIPRSDSTTRVPEH